MKTVLELHFDISGASTDGTLKKVTQILFIARPAGNTSTKSIKRAAKSTNAIASKKKSAVRAEQH